MSLKTFFFHKYYKHFDQALNDRDRDRCLSILEDAGLEETCYRWKGLVLKFVDHFGKVPDHIHNMMILSEGDLRTQDYLNHPRS